MNRTPSTRDSKIPLIMVLLLALLSCSPEKEIFREEDFRQASDNGRLANEAFIRSLQLVYAWLEEADSESGLIPRNLQRDTDIWNARDSAADNYPFMVLTAALLDRPLFDGRMQDMLEAERTLTSRVGTLPDTYSFSKKDFLEPEVDLDSILFGSSEYIKDGLLPLTEWLGPSPWSSRMLEILDDMWARAPVPTPYGDIVSTNVEVNGEMLQTLARVYWMTGEEKYLDWAVRLGDYYLLGHQHPTRDFERLRLRDHGCEVVSGLTELYAAVATARPEKRRDYRAPIHVMLDRILEIGRNEHGLFFNRVNPGTGEVLDSGIADNFGYTLNGFYTVYLLDGTKEYRDAVLQALDSLDVNYRRFDWERGSADGYADAIEGALNLYNREPVPSVAAWLDSEIRVMWDKQQPSGIVEGWHGDGNFARTSIMYGLWKTAGLTVQSWREDVVFGATQAQGSLLISIQCADPWEGTLLFDKVRHKSNFRLPMDWPRINQFPEWFTVDPSRRYQIQNLTLESDRILDGTDLIQGIPLTLDPGVGYQLAVGPVSQ